jgi:hypothetical protein
VPVRSCILFPKLPNGNGNCHCDPAPKNCQEHFISVFLSTITLYTVLKSKYIESEVYRKVVRTHDRYKLYVLSSDGVLRLILPASSDLVHDLIF